MGRSEFDGGLLGLIGVKILSFIIIVFTLGIATPAALCMKYRWVYKHTIIEGKRLKFVGSGISLFGHFIKWWFFTLITLGISGFWLSIKIRQWEIRNVQFE